MTETLTSDQIFIKKLKDIVEANLENKDFGVNELASNSGLSRTSLNRKLRKILNKSINQFIREVRLQKAFEMLRNDAVTASEVAYKVGFSSPAYFNTCFNKYFGFPPGKVKETGFEPTERNFFSAAYSYQEQKKPVLKNKFMKFSGTIFITALIFLFFYNLFPQVFKGDSFEKMRSSDKKITVVVIPFQNMTNDTIWDVIQDYLVSYLSGYEELRIIQKAYINYLLENRGLSKNASVSPSVAGAISQNLQADIFISGTVIRTNSDTYINTQLGNSKTKEVLRSFIIKVQKENDGIFEKIDSLSVLVKNYLIKSEMEKKVSPDLKPYRYTDSPDAYRYFIMADRATMKRDMTVAADLYFKAVEADSNFIPAIIFLSMRYANLGKLEDARKWCLKAYHKREIANKNERIMIEWYHATLFETPNEEIKYLRQFVDAYDQLPVAYWQTGNAYLKLFQYENGIPEYKKALEIYKKWGVKPMLEENYTMLGYSYHKLGKFNLERKIYRKAARDFPDNRFVFFRYAVMYLTIGHTIDANRYIEKYRSVLKNLSFSEAQIKTNVAFLYSEAGILEKAEEFYREALSLDPQNVRLINEFAYFLIDNDLNIIEGLELVESALRSGPDNYSFLDTKGWGLYKQGRLQEALDTLQKSWSLKPVYDHTIFLHIEKAKKALSDQKKPVS